MAVINEFPPPKRPHVRDCTSVIEGALGRFHRRIQRIQERESLIAISVSRWEEELLKRCVEPLIEGLLTLKQRIPESERAPEELLQGFLILDLLIPLLQRARRKQVLDYANCPGINSHKMIRQLDEAVLSIYWRECEEILGEPPPFKRFLGYERSLGEEIQSELAERQKAKQEKPDSEAGLKTAKTNESEKQGAESAPNDGLWGIPNLQVFKKSGEKWVVCYAGKTRFFSDIKGFHFLEFLFERPKKSIPSNIIEKLGNNPKTPNGGILLKKMSSEQLAEQESMMARPNLEFAQHDLGEMTNEKSIAKCRAELGRIDGELDRLPKDSPEGPMLEADKEKIIQHLSSVLKLGGKIRTFGGPSEKARKNVSRHLKRAIKKIQKEFPVLAACLDSAVRRGTECCYNPPNLPS